MLKEKPFEFALEIISLDKVLAAQKREYVLSKQLLRPGTSMGANIREVQNTQSIADFILQLSISQKACDESIYWLELLFHSKYIHETEFNEPVSETK